MKGGAYGALLFPRRRKVKGTLLPYAIEVVGGTELATDGKTKVTLGREVPMRSLVVVETARSLKRSPLRTRLLAADMVSA